MPVPACVRTFTTGRADAGARVSGRAVPNLVARARDCPPAALWPLRSGRSTFRSSRRTAGERVFVCLSDSVVLGIGCTRIRSCARSNENENIASEECSIYLTLIVCVAVGCACENPERTGELRSEPNAARRPRRPQAGAPRAAARGGANTPRRFLLALVIAYESTLGRASRT